MAKKLDDHEGLLNNAWQSERYKKGDMSVLRTCRHCGKPNATDDVIVVCPGCDLIERTPR